MESHEIIIIIGSILVLLYVIINEIIFKHVESKRYIDKARGYRIDYPNKNWVTIGYGSYENCVNPHFFEQIFKYKDSNSSFSLIFRIVTAFFRKKKDSLQDEIIDIEKSWDSLASTDNKFSYFLCGRDIKSIQEDKTVFRRALVGTREAFEFSFFWSFDETKAQEIISENVLPKEIVEKLKYKAAEREELYIFFEFNDSLFCCLACTGIGSNPHPHMRKIVYEFLKNLKSIKNA